ncbi:AAA family ATPase [Dactylosporangium cerinum]|uniref:AAA family ATPase n=1 Tax=Dactylosporangium cerinum TaxID=1434730 RepID=A0ABV9W066_9ACTN
MWQPVRHALTLSVSRFADAPDLPFAPAAAAELASALVSLGYAAIPAPAGEPTGAVLGAAVHSALTGPPEDVVIVHVLTHGELIEHTGSLYAVGSDGKHESTEVESWLKAVEDFRDRPLVLFLLDLCHAGTAARLSWQLRTAGGGARAWVLAAAGPAEAAFGGRFTSSAAAVLRRLAEGRLGIDPSVRHVRLGTIVQATRIELTDRRRAAGGFDQTIMATVLDLAEEPDLPFFVNPGYREDPRDRLRDAVDEAIRPFLAEVDPALDPAHFVGRARGRRLGPGDPLLGSFCGRGEQLRNLADWMDGAGAGTGAGLHLVIGSAGTGKSALLGVLVCAAHPVLSEPTRGLWHHVAAVPSVNDALAAIHARQRTLQQIIESLAAQLLMRPRAGESWTAAVLISEMRGRSSVPVVVIDAVDEAAAPLELVNDLLLPLARARRTDGTAACRLVASVRPWPEFGDLVQWARRGRTLVDLDAIPSGELRTDLREYVAGLLRSSTVYRRFAYRQVCGAVAAAVAETLAPDALPDGEPRWAPYLLAGVVVQELVDRPEPVTAVETAVRVAKAVPLTVPDLLDRDLSALGDRPWLRPALSALAFGYGDGMPARVVALLAPGFAEVGTDPAGPSGNDIADALDSASFYLRRSVDVDGTTLYRLFHHSLPERLRGRHPDGPSVVMHRLMGWARPAGLPARWDASEPYLLRHAIQHAVEADDVDRLLSDPEFLVHADPVTLTPELGRAGDDRARRAAAVYRAARHDGTTRPAVRRRVLAVEAIRQRDPEMARRLRPSSIWEPIWARGTPHPTASGGRTTPVWAVAFTHVDGRPVVSAQVEHGALSFWEPATGKAVADPLFTESGRVRTLAGTQVDGHPVLVIGSEDGSVRAWDFVRLKL